MAFREARITEQIDWAPGYRSIRVAGPMPSFRPGQWVQLALDLEGRRRQQSYSMASAPGEPGEFLFTRVPEGRLTPALFALGPGDPLLVGAHAAGAFTLDEVADAPELWLLATGTGLAPYVSMLRTPEPWERFERLVLVHGVRQRRHLAYREELARRSAEHAGQLTWIPAVTREAPPDGGLAGRIPDLLEAGTLEERAGARLRRGRAQVLLCGNPGMIQGAMNLLYARGLRAPEQISTEAYW